MPNTGRLTLSWVGKDQALLGRADGSYEWVSRDDPRVTEVRVLHETDTVGRVSSTARAASDNLLIVGDSYHALHSLTCIPEYAEEYRGRVKLVYLDPPFNTGQAFEHYDDALEHSVWLTMMRDRLLLLRDLLARDGTIWVHLDDAEIAYCRVLMDEVFGRANFVSTVIWEKSDSPRNSARFLSVDHDYILVYALDAEEWLPNRLPRSEAINAKYKNPDGDPRGPWFGDNLRANKPYSLGQYTVTGPTGRTFAPPKGKFWRISQERFDALNEAGAIYWGKNGDAFPTQKRYLSEVGDMVPRTLWKNNETGSNRTSRNEIRRLFSDKPAFATPKPELLLERVLQIATSPGDIVLDCFAGAGTTAAVAHKMGRRWITAELSPNTVQEYTHPRLEKVTLGQDPGGITEQIGWEKGGGFRVLEVGPSMYDLVNGRAFLAGWVTNGVFSEAVAAQLGFRVEHAPPFSGWKGRSRLAVCDGVVDEQVVRAVVARLGDGERAVVVGKGSSADAATLLKELSPGSRLRKAPRDLLKRGVVR